MTSITNTRPVLPLVNDSLQELRTLGVISGEYGLRLHLGCGERHFDGYVNIDYPPSEHTCQTRVAADVFADITKLRFPAGSVEEIRLHHVFEHFDRASALALLCGWHRWLRDGGRLVLETPDLQASMQLLSDSNISYQKKQAVMRHVFGSHEASWAVHWDGWYEEKYRHILGELGYEKLAFEFTEWQMSRNITVRAQKVSSLPLDALRSSVNALLKDSLILESAESEQLMIQTWLKKFDDLVGHMVMKSVVVDKSVTSVPLVSIFMPAYNREKYLPATLDSLLVQSFGDFELIIADDGSTDRTLEIAHRYAARDKRIKVVSLPHQGEVTARNQALRYVHPEAKYLLNHDSDDISLPNKLLKLVGFLQTHSDVAIVGCFAEYFNDAGDRLGQPPIESQPERIRATFSDVNSMINSAALIRRSVFEKIGGYREAFRSVDDYDFFARALLAGFTLANITDVLHRIRLHPSSVGSTRANQQQVLAAKIRAFLKEGREVGETGPVVLFRAADKARRNFERKSLTVLHTVEFYAPHLGGAELVVQQISERLVKRGHRVTVATSHLPERNFQELNGVQIRSFAVRGKMADGVFGDIKGYQQFLNSSDFDVMMNYAAQVWPSDLAFPLIATGRGKRVNVLAPCGYSALVDERTLRWPHYKEYFEKTLPTVLPRYDAVVYHSSIYKDFLFGNSLELTNGLVIPNGTDEAEFTQPVKVNFREKYQLSTRFYGLCVANFYPDKGQERIIECVRQMNRRDFTMVFIGKEGAELEKLREQSKGLNVRFIVAPPREDTVAAFRSADVFLFGSHIEASPLVIIEAKAARLPFVSTDCGNVREWKGGVVCSPEEMAKQTTRLLDEPAYRKQLGDEGWREWKEKLTWEAVTDRWEDLYLRLDHAKGGRAAAVSRSTAAAPTVGPEKARSQPVGEVVVKLQGGMGNQMFQYAAGLALARRTGSSLKLDLSFLLDRTPRPNFTFRDFDLDLFTLTPECEVVKTLDPAAARRVVPFREKHFHFDPQFESLSTNVYLDGYWQTPRYFQPVLDEVRQAFKTFRTPFNPVQQALAEKIRAHNSVCLNVRRGDYVANPVTNAFHGVCDERYFAQAVRYIMSRVPDAHFYIFSDDVEWCRSANLVAGAPSTVVSHEYAGDRFGSYLQLMMACRHFIIPNSSFAWWAAFLGQTPESIVVAPTPWFSDMSVEYIDLLPTSWTCMSRMPGPVLSDLAPTPKVSVIIPCYKQAHYLQEAVESVVAQTFGDWELIVVNDGSPDDTSKVARDLIARHPERRIRLLEKPNGGLADARNAGIREARGKYILPLDSDDRIHPAMLEKTVGVLESSPDVAIAYVDQQYFAGETKVVRLPEYDFRQHCSSNYFAYCSLYRKEIWAASGGYRSNMVWGYEDWDFWIGCGEKGFSGKRVPEVLFYYRVKAGSMLTTALAHDKELKSQIVLNHPSLYDEATRNWATGIGGTAGKDKAPTAAPVEKFSADEQLRETDTTPTDKPLGHRIVALMSAYNEGDIIYHAIGDLIENGLSVYLIDNHSTDNTVAEASRWLGKGLLKIERFPGDVAGYSTRGSKEYVWREILRRKEDLSGQLEAAWFLHVDADEFRESPWPGLTLADAIRKVEALGYNAINFDLYNFRPTDDGFVPGQDVRQHIAMYQPGELFDAVQIKAWKNPGAPAQLVNNGGHSVAIPQRRVCPINFILRHYPIRGETHGRRKVYQDRLPRFAKEEVAINWHVQYNAFVDGSEKFLHKPEALVAFDGARERAKLLARFSEDILLAQTISGGSTMTHGLSQEAAFAWITRRLAMPEPLAPEVGLQAEQVLVSFLNALEKKQEIPVEEIDGQLARLLLALLEMKLAFARLEGNSHLACLAMRLDAMLRPRVSADPIPDGASAPNETLPESDKAVPLVSVCIPTYNGEAFIAETFASALAQTYPAIEVIVSDDGSTDGTLEIVEKMAKDSRVPVRVLHHEPCGMVANWEHCIANARGKYVKFLFQDDLLMPDCVEQLVSVARQDSGIGLVFSPRKIEKRGVGKAGEALDVAYRDGLDLHKGWSKLASIQPGLVLLNDPQLLKNPINKIGEPTTVLLSKTALTAVGGFDTGLKQLVDVELWLRIMTQYKVGFCDKELSCFRLHPKQATQVNLQEGAIAEDWKRFYGKLAEHPAFDRLPEVHRAHARQMYEQLGGVALVGSADPVSFQQALGLAESLLKEGRTDEAIAQMEAVIKLAPSPEGMKHAQDILALLKEQNQKVGTETVEAAGGEGGDFFDADEVRNIEQIIAAYKENPAAAEVRGQLEALQQNMMQFLVTAKFDELERLFKGGFGRVFRAIAGSGLPAEQPTEDALTQLGVLDEALVGSTDKFDFRPLLARMLCAPAFRGKGAISVALQNIPAWLLEDYLGYVLLAPQVFVANGEAEQYHEHLSAWARVVVQQIRMRPNEPLTKVVASAFAFKVNFIPLYVSARSARELSEQRAAIMEFVLRKDGASVTATLPKRPKARAKIKVGFLSAHFGAQTETHVTLPALQLDRTKFELCLFAVSANSGPVEERCRGLADSFTVLPQKLDQQVKAIRDAVLDVLIVGTNVTAVTNQVSLIALHRLAPLQLASYCSPISTGMRSIDGYLSGSLNKFPGVQDQFTEKLHFCEGAPGCLDYTVEGQGSGKHFARASLGLAADDVVFINAASCFKILPEMQETWVKILKAVPHSRMLLLPFNPNWASAFPVKQFERTLAGICARHDLDYSRFLMVGPQTSRADVKALEQLGDVYLDTAPFSGSISVIDPLELGLPTVVWEANTHRSRAAAALVRALDMPELIAENEDAYIKKAVALATDSTFRKQTQQKILERMALKPSFLNPAAYAVQLGAILERVVLGKKQAVVSA